MKRLLLLLPVFLIVITSGCVLPGGIELPFLGGGVTYESDIVIVKDIRAIPNSVRAGEQVRLIAYIQNTGSNTVPDTSSLSDDMKTKKIKVELYDHCSGLFDTGDIEVTCGGTATKGKTGCEIDKLLPGEIREIDWTLRSNPNTNLVTPCELKVFVQYPYATDGLTTISFIQQAEYQRQLEQGTFQTKAHYTAKGEGPVKIYFSVKDQEPIQSASAGTASYTSVSLDFQNMGYGFLANPTPDVEKTSPRILNSSIFLKIPKDMPIKIGECELVSFVEADTLELAGYMPKEDVKLIQNKRSLPCRIKIIEDSSVNKEVTFQLEAKASYLYEFRQSAKVTVSPPV
jgi:hypothetical protein